VWQILLTIRILEFLNPTKTGTNGEAASLVFGQASFITRVAVTSSTGVAWLERVKIGPSGNLWEVDLQMIESCSFPEQVGLNFESG
jgi:hypothetical protein